MLDHKSAKELEQRVLSRLTSEDNQDTFVSQARRAAVRATIITIQEYERMQHEQQN